MNILITGGTGFIGSHLIKYFLDNTDWNITTIDRIGWSATQNRLTPLPENAKNGRLKVIWHDFKAPLNDFVINDKFDYIFHLANSSNVENSILDPISFVMDNVVGTTNLLTWYKDTNPQAKFLYFSTDEVFGPAPGDTNYKEWDRYNSGNPYAASKAGAEEMCLAFANTYNLPISITHTMNVIGEMQYYKKFLPICIWQILTDQQVQIYASKNYKPGSRFYIYVKNVCKAVHFLSSRMEKGQKYNIVGEKEIDNGTFASTICTELYNLGKIEDDVFDFKLVDFHSSRPGHDLRYGLDGTVLKVMGFTFKSTIYDDIKDIVKWYVENPEWLGLK